MAMSYRRVSVLLPVPPHNQNSAFIIENTNMESGNNKQIKKRRWLAP